MNFCVIRRLIGRGQQTCCLEVPVDPISVLVFGEQGRALRIAASKCSQDLINELNDFSDFLDLDLS